MKRNLKSEHGFTLIEIMIVDPAEQIQLNQPQGHKDPLFQEQAEAAAAILHRGRVHAGAEDHKQTKPDQYEKRNDERPVYLSQFHVYLPDMTSSLNKSPRSS